jgi:hypothetical protein
VAFVLSLISLIGGDTIGGVALMEQNKFTLPAFLTAFSLKGLPGYRWNLNVPTAREGIIY